MKTKSLHHHFSSFDDALKTANHIVRPDSLMADLVVKTLEKAPFSKGQKAVLFSQVSMSLETGGVEGMSEKLVVHALLDPLKKSLNLLNYIPDPQMRSLMLSNEEDREKLVHFAAKTIAASLVTAETVSVVLDVLQDLERKKSISQSKAFNIQAGKSAYGTERLMLQFLSQRIFPKFASSVGEELGVSVEEFQNQVIIYKAEIKKDPKSQQFQGLDFFGPIDRDVWIKSGPKTDLTNDIG